MTEALVIALLASIASRTASRPLVAEIADHMTKAGIYDVALVMNTFDERTKTAVDQWCLTLQPDVSGQSIEKAARAWCKRRLWICAVRWQWPCTLSRLACMHQQE